MTLPSPRAGPSRLQKSGERCTSGLSSGCSQRLYWFDELPEVLQYNKYVRSGYRARKAIQSPVSSLSTSLLASSQWNCPLLSYGGIESVASPHVVSLLSVQATLCRSVCAASFSSTMKQVHLLKPEATFGAPESHQLSLPEEGTSCLEHQCRNDVSEATHHYIADHCVLRREHTLSSHSSHVDHGHAGDSGHQAMAGGQAGVL